MSKSGDAFMKMDKRPYVGEYVGMCDGVIVAHSKSFDEVYEATKRACGPTKIPFVSEVLPAECMLL
ncbi:MAG: hypothetical protein IJ248_00805 [Candidatus Methanomethylophilaceae archaeon]|nr:hypothetical protein [Candidatus Methanomethylophilaceae archaeon]